MRAQVFADRCATIFLYGLPITLISSLFLAVNLGIFAPGALPFVMPVAAIAAYLIPAIGLAGVCVGIWCYFRKDYGHLPRQILVLAVLAVYIALAITAGKAHRAMKLKHATMQQAPAAAQGRQDAQCPD